ncbi:uncharacterized protein Dana_GF19229 [Drosophila ananassae]|uniref:Uncharacterized protein n=1 Tax=Drosophila ananassae TaxID=7217 RepID=B3MZT1_DROAN|nr:uncharacterized protein Dana_GF19229 [Drosophila ananassae]
MGDGDSDGMKEEEAGKGRPPKRGHPEAPGHTLTKFIFKKLLEKVNKKINKNLHLLKQLEEII